MLPYFTVQQTNTKLYSFPYEIYNFKFDIVETFLPLFYLFLTTTISS